MFPDEKIMFDNLNENMLSVLAGVNNKNANLMTYSLNSIFFFFLSILPSFFQYFCFILSLNLWKGVRSSCGHVPKEILINKYRAIYVFFCRYLSKSRWQGLFKSIYIVSDLTTSLFIQENTWISVKFIHIYLYLSTN